MNRVTPARIAELLQPFRLTLDEFRLNQISAYVDLLDRWNSRINLTAIRDPEEIVVRHFGESLFAANILYPGTTNSVGADVSTMTDRVEAEPAPSLSKHVLTRPAAGSSDTKLIDVGSGPGFPGLPIKLWKPSLDVTLIESNMKKVTFLREVIRALTLTGIDVFPARAETHGPAIADVVTFRAVERFEQSLPAAAGLLAPRGRLALLIGTPQVDQAHHLAPDFAWNLPIPFPTAKAAVVLVGTKGHGPKQ
jgi:16S rRNA (guanine527-N7)-methyltransferase